MSHRAFSDDDRAFIRAILTNPAEVSGWLVYADWLDDNEQPERAEFLRLHVELGQLDGRDKRCSALCARLTQLSKCIDSEWAAVFDQNAFPVKFFPRYVTEGRPWWKFW